MKVLLDTHALFWLITGDERLSEIARQTFLDPENDLFFSIVSLWETCIKKSLGKISLRPGWLHTIQDEMKANAIQWLYIEIAQEQPSWYPFVRGHQEWAVDIAYIDGFVECF